MLWRPFGLLGTLLVAIHGPRYLFLVSKPPDFVTSSIQMQVSGIPLVLSNPSDFVSSTCQTQAMKKQKCHTRPTHLESSLPYCHPTTWMPGCSITKGMQAFSKGLHIFTGCCRWGTHLRALVVSTRPSDICPYAPLLLFFLPEFPIFSLRRCSSFLKQVGTSFTS